MIDPKKKVTKLPCGCIYVGMNTLNVCYLHKEKEKQMIERLQKQINEKPVEKN
jgi:hypothetical protein